MTTYRPLIDRHEAEARLKSIFPPDAFDTVLSSRLAGSAIAAMIYVGAVVGDDDDPPVPENVWARPATVLQMSDEVMAMTTEAERQAWTEAQAVNNKKIASLLKEAGSAHTPWYADNSRETLRDETWPGWRRHGAIRQRQGIATNSSLPRWALTASFADLFKPDLGGQDLADAIGLWRNDHMDPGDVLRIHRANELAKASYDVVVSMPPFVGATRSLEPGLTSQILKGVIEEWAPARLANPFVVAISEPGAKAWAQDTKTLAAAGISINVSSVLPDAIIVDIGAKPPEFWIIEAVATDGEIDEDSKSALLAWAADQYIDPAHCQFMSAFSSRHHPAARRRLKDLAVGTFAWFLDEPGRELAWYDISS